MSEPTGRSVMRATEAWRTAVRNHGTDSPEASRAKSRADRIRAEYDRLRGPGEALSVPLPYGGTEVTLSDVVAWHKADLAIRQAQAAEAEASHVAAHAAYNAAESVEDMLRTGAESDRTAAAWYAAVEAVEVAEIGLARAEENEPCERFRSIGRGVEGDFERSTFCACGFEYADHAEVAR